MHRGRRGERRSLSEADYAALLSAAHQQLHAPIILIWDNLNTHLSKRDAGVHRSARRLADRRAAAGLRLAYAPELNAPEGVWSHLKRGLGNCVATGIDQLVTLVKTRLKRIPYHPELLDGFLGQTGLTLQPVRP